MSSYYNHETHNSDDDADLDDRYYPAAPHNHDAFEDMLNCNECWLDEAAARKAQAEQNDERYFADELNGYFADRQGFHDPKKAAEHAIMIQCGYSTPLREAGRMIKDGGVSAERARAWLAVNGYTENDVER
jgi:hypothetical protein